MAGRRVVYLLVLAASVVFYWAYREWMSWMVLLAVLGLPVLSLLLSIPGMALARGKVYCPDWIPMDAVWGTWLQPHCRLPLPVFRGRIRVTRQLTGESWVMDDGTALPTQHCGMLTCVPEKLRFYDHLGLFSHKCKENTPSVTLVRPRPVAMTTPPDLSRYMDRSWRPKAGGGYAENHELRLYRPGDSLNQVHWKLTAKTGKLIIREAMEPERNRMLLTLDLKGNADELDKLLGNVLWLSTYLLRRGFSHELRVLTGEGIVTLAVGSEAALGQAMDRLLSATSASQGSVLDHPVAATWQYHVGGEAP